MTKKTTESSTETQLRTLDAASLDQATGGQMLTGGYVNDNGQLYGTYYDWNRDMFYDQMIPSGSANGGYGWSGGGADYWW